MSRVFPVYVKGEGVASVHVYVLVVSRRVIVIIDTSEIVSIGWGEGGKASLVEIGSIGNSETAFLEHYGGHKDQPVSGYNVRDFVRGQELIVVDRPSSCCNYYQAYQSNN